MALGGIRARRCHTDPLWKKLGNMKYAAWVQLSACGSASMKPRGAFVGLGTRFFLIFNILPMSASF